jgi:hypothetical protein
MNEIVDRNHDEIVRRDHDEETRHAAWTLDKHRGPCGSAVH